MTRYYSRNCYANAEKRIEGWHYDLRLALWCHSIRRPKVHPLDSICAKDTGRPKRRLNKHERDEITDIISESPWQLTKQEIRNVIARTKIPPWELEVGRVKSGKLTGKVAIVTGAASGISRATALLFAEEGAYTIIADIDSKGGEEAVTQARASGGNAEFQSVDATDPSQVEALVADTLSTYGALDILVNGAAYQTETGPVADVTEEEWDSGLDLFLKAPFLGCKYAIPAMLKGGGGAIINISSAVVLRGSTFSLPYSVAKAGIVQLTKTTNSQYCTRGIRANCILPGVIDTPGSRRVSNSPSIAAKYADGIPVGRMGVPQDVAKLALYLASDDAAYVAGASFLIDGGINNL